VETLGPGICALWLLGMLLLLRGEPRTARRHVASVVLTYLAISLIPQKLTEYFIGVVPILCFVAGTGFRAATGATRTVIVWLLIFSLGTSFFATWMPWAVPSALQAVRGQACKCLIRQRQQLAAVAFKIEARAEQPIVAANARPAVLAERVGRHVAHERTPNNPRNCAELRCSSSNAPLPTSLPRSSSKMSSQRRTVSRR